MKFLITSLLLSLVLLELCQAQDQNCQDASCDHARKKRQVIEEILNEVEEVDREKREAFFGKKHRSSASARSHGHSKHATKHSVHHGHHQASYHHVSKPSHHHVSKPSHHHVSKPSHHHASKPSHHSKHGSSYGYHGSSHGHHASKRVHHKRDADAQSQNCFGSACNQNNFGKKKRDIVEAINSLTAEVLESEDVDEVVAAQEKERRNADPQSQNCFGSACNQNNFGKKKRDAVEDDVDDVEAQK